jgi:hypothetical protein
MTQKNLSNPDLENKFLLGILDKSVKLIQHLDAQTNILIGISSAIFVFMAVGLRASELNLSQIILGVFAAMAALTALFAIHPPAFMRKRGQAESLMYHKKIVDFKSPKTYQKELEKVVINRDKMLEQYSREIYNLNKYYYLPKRKVFKLARNILLAGVFLSILAYLISLIYF